MELNELIGYALGEIEAAKNKYEQKANYLIDEVNLEINVSKFESINGGLKIVVFNAGGEANSSQTHKVNIKLKPKPKQA